MVISDFDFMLNALKLIVSKASVIKYYKKETALHRRTVFKFDDNHWLQKYENLTRIIENDSKCS